MHCLLIAEFNHKSAAMREIWVFSPPEENGVFIINQSTETRCQIFTDSEMKADEAKVTFQIALQILRQSSWQ